MATAGERALSPLSLVTTTAVRYEPDRAKRWRTVGVDVVCVEPSPKSQSNRTSRAASPLLPVPGFDPVASKSTSSGLDPLVGEPVRAAVGPTRTWMSVVAEASRPLASVSVTLAVYVPGLLYTW